MRRSATTLNDLIALCETASLGSTPRVRWPYGRLSSAAREDGFDIDIVAQTHPPSRLTPAPVLDLLFEAINRRAVRCTMAWSSGRQVL